MLGKIIDQIEKDHGVDAVTGVYLSLIGDIKKELNLQQKELTKIKKQYSKIKKARLDKKRKTSGSGFIYFNGIYEGEINKKKLPNGNGTIMFKSRDKDYPDDNDMYIGEFFNGTKTGLGEYSYLNERNIGKHPFDIPYYLGEWSGDSYYGLGSKLIDKFDTIQTYEGEFRNNKAFGFGKWIDKNDGNGDIELIGYFDDGMAIGFGLRIQKDKKENIVFDQSGLCEYDNTDINNKKSIMHFKFLDKDFWKIIDDKSKRAPIIQTIYDVVINKGYFNEDISDEKFRKLKLKVQSLHTELLYEVNSYIDKNNGKNSKFDEFINKQGELKNYLLTCDKFDQLNECDELVKQSIQIFKSLKKLLEK